MSSPVSTILGMGAATTFVLFTVGGLGNVEVTEFALNYSFLTKKVEQKTYTAGRHWVGPFNWFVKFPAMLRTIQFSDDKMQTDLPASERGEGLLRSRTKDGLDVLIELSFQYQLQQSQLFNLYVLLGPDPYYHQTYIRIATDVITQAATHYTANEYFVNRSTVGNTMERALRAAFEKDLFALVNSFQMRSVQLPQEFEDAIQETEVANQDVKRAMAEQSAQKVSLETELMQAQKRTKVANNTAQAQAQAVMLANKADIEQYTVTQEKSADSYAKVMDQLESSENMLAYIRSRVLRSHPSERTILGLGPEGPEK